METQNQETQEKKPTAYEVAVSVLSQYINRANQAIREEVYRPGIIEAVVKKELETAFLQARQNGQVQVSNNALKLVERVVELASIYPTFLKATEAAETLVALEKGELDDLTKLSTTATLAHSAYGIMPLTAGQVGNNEKWFNKEDRKLENRVNELAKWVSRNFTLAMEDNKLEEAPVFWSMVEFFVRYLSAHVAIIGAKPESALNEEDVESVRAFSFSGLPVCVVFNKTYGGLLEHMMKSNVSDEALEDLQSTPTEQPVEDAEVSKEEA